MGEIPRILFLRENFPKLDKILRLSSEFWRVTLKNVKMLLKNLFLRNSLHLSLYKML